MDDNINCNIIKYDDKLPHSTQFIVNFFKYRIGISQKIQFNESHTINNIILIEINKCLNRMNNEMSTINKILHTSLYIGWCKNLNIMRYFIHNYIRNKCDKNDLYTFMDISYNAIYLYQNIHISMINIIEYKLEFKKIIITTITNIIDMFIIHINNFIQLELHID